MSFTEAPMISVLMSVYNAEEFLHAAIDSILAQTYEDFEFIIIEDASTDKSQQIISSYKDQRIILIQNPNNLGLARSLNKGINLAKGKYIARMDADDISLPKRFEKQLSFMEKNLDVGVCGTWVKTFGHYSGIWEVPVSHEFIIMTMLFKSCLMHPTVLIRRSILLALDKIYDESFEKGQDYELWTRLASTTHFANIPQILLNYRIHAPTSHRVSHKTSQIESGNKIRENYIKSQNIQYSFLELDLHNNLACKNYQHTAEFATATKDWLLKIWRNNEAHTVVSTEICENILARKMFDVCSNLSKDLNTFPIFLSFTNSIQKDFYKLKIKLFKKRFINR